MRSITFSAGDVVFRQGSFELSMFDILEGRIGVYTDYGTPMETELAILGKGQLLGEMGMIEACPRSATAVALDNGTVLNEVTEDELSFYLRNKPELLLRVMKQLSSRIRETSDKYYLACRALLENEEAHRSGVEKSESLNQQLETIREDAEHYAYLSGKLRSSFFQYVLEDLAAYGRKCEPVSASFPERLFVHWADPEKLHVNPDDEFAKPSVGPNDRIINKYVQMIPSLVRFDEDVFPEPVIVHKMKPDGYMILNGHHRWAAALKTGLSKLRIEITNPKK